MGVIAKQSFQFSIISILGLVISVIASLTIYPLSFAIYGKFQFIIAISQILIPLFTLGLTGTIIKYFQNYEEHNKRAELLGTVLLAVVALIGMNAILYPLYRPYLIQGLEYIDFDMSIYRDNEFVIILVTILSAITLIINSYLSNFQKIVVPGILGELSIKIILPLLVLSAFLYSIQFESLAWTLCIVYAIILIMNWAYTIYLKKSEINLPTIFTKDKWKAMTSYSIYGMLNTVAFYLVYRLDIVMITLLIGETETGYYSLFLFMASVIEIPARGVIKISAPIVAKHMESQRYKDVEDIYTKASTNLMLLCAIIGITIYAGLASLLPLINDGNILLEFIGVWFVLVLGKWINQSTSLNSHIINYSDFYKYNFYILAFQSIFNIVFNYFFILQFGLIGAAFATTLSIVINNIIKLILIRVKLQLWPFNRQSLKIVILSVTSICLLFFIPLLGIPFIDIFLRCSVIAFLMISISYKMNISEELNRLLNKVGQKVKTLGNV